MSASFLDWLGLVWRIVNAEPKWLMIVGLYLDLFGGILIAFTAWFRLSIPGVTGMNMGTGMIATGDIEEPSGPLRWRRRLVIFGGALLAGGFLLQIIANHLQMALA